MSWILLVALVLALGAALGAALLRRMELTRMERRLGERERAVRLGSAHAQLQHPIVDLTLCVGCGACVRVCPEDGVLDLVHGQAMVVNGARCTGVSACEAECPTGAITVALTDTATRRDIPAVSESLEAVGTPNLFLAGEVTARALIRNAILQGTAVAAEVARRAKSLDGRVPGEGAPSPESGSDGDVLDLVVVGAGPAGLACSLEAQRLGLRFVTLDQESTVGGTVARYPRRKLILTQSVELPQGGRLDRESYTKEELMEMWTGVARERDLPLRTGQSVTAIQRDARGRFLVRTATEAWPAKHVCLALGRRGTPRKLEVPGEDLPKVSYAMIDANAYQGRRVLVVGGGETAGEATLALAEQPGNEVTLSYRKDTFFRLRERTEERLRELVAAGRVRVILSSRVLAIREESVDIAITESGVESAWSLPNDEVFVMAGGIPPFALLEQSGVSFDPSQRPVAAPIAEQGSGLVRALAIGLCLSVAALSWAIWNSDYYGLPADARPMHDKHTVLRPGLGTGLMLGIMAAALVAGNLMYLARRSPKVHWLRFGSLRAWMTSHVATGILALLCALLHAGMSAGDSIGGHAFLALVILFASGAIGRYLYAYVPRAANGRELELEEVRVRLGRLADAWTGTQREFGDRARAAVAALVEKRQWRSSLPARLAALAMGQRELSHTLSELRAEGHAAGIPADQLDETIVLAREAHRTALATAHFEDVRGLVAAWRWLHRWVALALVLLLVIHVIVALTYGTTFTSGGLT